MWIVAHSRDRDAAEEIESILVDRGVDGSIYTSWDSVDRALAIVVVMSSSLSADADLLLRLASVRDRRLIPVRIGNLDGVDLPPFLAELNWILWDTTEPANRNAALLTAVRSDVGRYREVRSLEAEAAAWEASGFHPDYLSADRGAVRQAMIRNAAAGHDSMSFPSARLMAYLDASKRSTSRAWWRRNQRWAFRVAVLVGVTVIAITGWQTVTAQRAANRLAVVLLNLNDVDRGDLSALKLAGLIDQQQAAGRVIPTSATGRLMELLARPWDGGIFTSGQNLALNAFAFTEPKSAVLVADGHGAVSMVSTEDGSVAWRHRLSDDTLVALAVTPGGHRAVAVDSANVVHGVDIETWATESAVLPGAAERIVISAPEAAVASLSNGVVAEVSFGAGKALRELGRYQNVLDLESTPEGSVRALVRSGPLLQIIDPLSGAVEAEEVWEETEFERGALYPGRGVVLSGRDNQLWFASEGLSLLPTGVPTSDVVRDLAVTPTGAVVFASDGFGAHLLDPRTQTVVPICATIDVIDSLALSIDGSQFICGSRGIGILSAVENLIADAEIPRLDTMNESKAASSQGSIEHVEIDDQGRVVARVNGELLNIVPTAYTLGGVVFGAEAKHPPVAWIPGPLLGGGDPTIVALTADGSALAVGTSTGVVSVLDANQNGELALASRWTAPDRQQVTALGFSDQSATLAIRTLNDRWWTAASCIGCGRDSGALLDAVTTRLWFCYSDGARDMLQPSVSRRLGVRDCPTMPEVQG